jgi:hypothetical protein
LSCKGMEKAMLQVKERALDIDRRINRLMKRTK